MEDLPLYISIVFTLTTLVTVIIFYKASRKSKTTLIILSAWLLIQALIGLSGFYTVTTTIPPRFVLMVLPPFLTILLLFLTKKGKLFLDQLDLEQLTLLHVIRIPVEIVLLWLFIYKAVPELMTFEGRNFDILSGFSAAFVYYYNFFKKKLSSVFLLIWNLICLALLLNIVVNAVLSAPFPFQQFAFDQPNIAVLYFPFNWLPSCVVPLVLLSHLAAIRQLLRTKES
jgi:hypothetical protein